MKINSYSQHKITNDDKHAVLEALDNQFLSGGELIEQFEQALVEYTGAKYAVICNSGTSALYMAYRALDLGMIITSPITFAATANAARMMGAYTVFQDVDDCGLLEPLSFKDCEMDRKPSALVPVHLNGSICDMKRLKSSWNGYIIEDACHALGADYNGKKVGSCEFSDMTVFSFHPLKSITTGEGGAVTTNSLELYKKLKALVQNGIYEGKQETYSGNFRMPAINAALGISQLKRLDENIRKRREAAAYYGLPCVPHSEGSAHHLYVLYSEKRDEIKARLEAAGVPCRIHYPPLDDLPRAKHYYSKVLSIPLYPSITKEQQDYVRSLCL